MSGINFCLPWNSSYRDSAVCIIWTARRSGVACEVRIKQTHFRIRVPSGILAHPKRIYIYIYTLVVPIYRCNARSRSGETARRPATARDHYDADDEEWGRASAANKGMPSFFQSGPQIGPAVYLNRSRWAGHRRSACRARVYIHRLGSIYISI